MPWGLVPEGRAAGRLFRSWLLPGWVGGWCGGFKRLKEKEEGGGRRRAEEEERAKGKRRAERSLGLGGPEQVLGSR